MGWVSMRLSEPQRRICLWRKQYSPLEPSNPLLWFFLHPAMPLTTNSNHPPSPRQTADCSQLMQSSCSQVYDSGMDCVMHLTVASQFPTIAPLNPWFAIFLERELGSPKSKIMRTRCKMGWPHNKVGPCLIPGRHFPTPTNTNWKDKFLMNPFCSYKSSIICLTLVFFCNFGIHILLSLTSYRHIGRFSPTLVARLLNSPYIYGAKTGIPK